LDAFWYSLGARRLVKWWKPRNTTSLGGKYTVDAHPLRDQREARRPYPHRYTHHHAWDTNASANGRTHTVEGTGNWEASTRSLRASTFRVDTTTRGPPSLLLYNGDAPLLASLQSPPWRFPQPASKPKTSRARGVNTPARHDVVKDPHPCCTTGMAYLASRTPCSADLVPTHPRLGPTAPFGPFSGGPRIPFTPLPAAHTHVHATTTTPGT
jgi:hypothetical protein